MKNRIQKNVEKFIEKSNVRKVLVIIQVLDIFIVTIRSVRFVMQSILVRCPIV